MFTTKQSRIYFDKFCRNSFETIFQLLFQVKISTLVYYLKYSRLTIICKMENTIYREDKSLAKESRRVYSFLL